MKIVFADQGWDDVTYWVEHDRKVAKRIIHLINDVGRLVNNDPDMRGRLKVIYPANYNVTMAERLIPAADLSEQISAVDPEYFGQLRFWASRVHVSVAGS